MGRECWKVGRERFPNGGVQGDLPHLLAFAEHGYGATAFSEGHISTAEGTHFHGRLHIVREAWLPAEHGPPGCHARISVLKHRLAAGEGEVQVLIRFADEGRMWL
jgi:hypothetical protein